MIHFKKWENIDTFLNEINYGGLRIKVCIRKKYSQEEEEKESYRELNKRGRTTLLQDNDRVVRRLSNFRDKH